MITTPGKANPKAEREKRKRRRNGGEVKSHGDSQEYRALKYCQGYKYSYVPLHSDHREADKYLRLVNKAGANSGIRKVRRMHTRRGPNGEGRKG